MPSPSHLLHVYSSESRVKDDTDDIDDDDDATCVFLSYMLHLTLTPKASQCNIQ